MYYIHNVHNLPGVRYNVIEYLGAYQIFSNEKRMKDCVMYASCAIQ
jgi:ribosomal protein S12